VLLEYKHSKFIDWAGLCVNRLSCSSGSPLSAVASSAARPVPSSVRMCAGEQNGSSFILFVSTCIVFDY